MNGDPKTDGIAETASLARRELIATSSQSMVLASQLIALAEKLAAYAESIPDDEPDGGSDG